MRIFLLALLVFFVGVISLSSCRKDKISDSPDAVLDFSADTVHFDTVFTTIGSVTKSLKVYNNNDERVRISEIRLAQGDQSNFRMNVDGIPADVVNDMEIAPGDSMWIFVEVTVDPNSLSSPFVIEDAIQFTTNGNEQEVTLVAWGRNAYFHGGPGQLNVLDCNEVWNADRPHVVYGIVAVDEGCCLTINEGTQVYCHKSSGLYVYRGCIDVNGQFGNEVVFQGDRLDAGYEDLAGQWGIDLTFEYEGDFGIEQATVARGGIWLYESTGSEIDYAVIKNGNIGIQVDTLGSNSTDALRLTNTKIENMGVIGLLGRGTTIYGNNNLITNCGQNCAYFGFGGSYQFEYTTFANYWTGSNRQTPAVVLSNYYQATDQSIVVRPLTETFFYNCIVWGNNAGLSDFSELVVDMVDTGNPDYLFSYCAVDSETSTADGVHYFSTLNGQTPPFIDASNGDFHLSSTASSSWNGGPATTSQTPFLDLDQVFRVLPGRKGCYEGQ
ncbi:MAG: hypothetical protein RL226_2076 [Bacteroidota bacterium]